MSRRLRELADEAIQQEDSVQEQPQPENPPAEPQQPVIEAAALSAEVIQPGGRMVSRKVMTIDRFMPGARQPNQPLPSQGRSQVPQPPPSSQAGRARKKQKVTDQPSTGPGDTVVQTPP